MRAPERSDEAGEREKGGGLLRLIISVALLAWLIRSFVFAPFSIPSGSMLPNMFIGDYVLTAKWPYGYSRYSFPFGIPSFEGRLFGNLPERGDVVVFRSEADPGIDVVKRVIGLPGDSVEMRSGRLVLNGEPVKRSDAKPFATRVSQNSQCRAAGAAPTIVEQGGERYCLYRAQRETLPGGTSYSVLDQIDRGPADEFAAITVPEDHLFLMGDNRDDSLDSRFSLIEGGTGLVPFENVIGQALAVFWSTDGSASYVKPWTWFTALRADRIGKTFGSSE